MKINHHAVRSSFGRAAKHYAKADFLAREIDTRMLDRLQYMRLDPVTILDLGCGCSNTLDILKKHYPKAQTIGLDSASEMLQTSSVSSDSHLISADACALPLSGGCTSLVWSNLLLLWLNKPELALGEAYRVLSDNGLFMFSTLGPDTLKELRSSFAQSEAHSTSTHTPHTQYFMDMHDIGDMLVACGFSDPVMDVEILTLTYDSLDTLLAEIKATGGHCLMEERQKNMTGKAKWQAFCSAYEQQRESNKLPVTIEVIYGHAWKIAKQPKIGLSQNEQNIIHFMSPA